MTCSDCGLSPIPKEDVVYVGAAVTCRACALGPPKAITVYVTSTGSWWVNDTAGGKPTEYVRADLVYALVDSHIAQPCIGEGCSSARCAALRALIKMRPCVSPSKER